MKKKAIILGAGLGGLSAAMSLAQLDEYEIHVLEKNHHRGGKLNIIEKEGFKFDLGPSIVTMPYIFEKLFTMHGKQMKDYIVFEPVFPHWRNFFEDGSTLDITATLDEMLSNVNLTTKDLEELKAFYDYSEKLYQFSNAVLFENQSERKLDTIKHYPLGKLVSDSDMFSTMDQGVRRFISNPYLIDILNYFIKYVGSSPYDAPAVLNLLPYIQWKFGLWYVKGGLFEISNGLAKLASQLNITFHHGVHIVDAKIQNNKISSLIGKDGTHYEADLFISNMEVIPFYKFITKESSAFLKPYEKKYGPACSGFALHLGVNTTYPQLAHHNFFYSNNSKQNFDNIFHNNTLNEDPTIYLVAPMKSDPNLGPQGSEIIKILPHIPVIDPNHPFTDEDYNTFKNHVLDKLERMGLTDLRKHIVVEETWTPHTILEAYQSNQGSIYGVVSDKKKNMGFKAPKYSSKYKNLFFVGGSVNPGGGMPMVILSGQQVIHQIKTKFKE
jgi:diapolycopene oxygenase